MKGLIARYCPGRQAEEGIGVVQYGLLIVAIVLALLPAIIGVVAAGRRGALAEAKTGPFP